MWLVRRLSLVNNGAMPCLCVKDAAGRVLCLVFLLVCWDRRCDTRLVFPEAVWLFFSIVALAVSFVGLRRLGLGWRWVVQWWFPAAGRISQFSDLRLFALRSDGQLNLDGSNPFRRDGGD